MGSRAGSGLARTAIGAALVTLCILAIGASSASASLTFAMPTPLDAGKRMRDVTCTSPTFCAAIDDAGNLFTTTDPTGGTAAWPKTHVANDDLYAISCAGTALCVITSNSTPGHIYASTNPAGGAAAWHLVYTNPGSNSYTWGVSCPTTSFCVAVDFIGDAITSTTPAVNGSWTLATLSATNDFSGVSCPSATSCVALQAHNDLWTSSAPGSGASGWTEVPFDAPNIHEAISCPTTQFCGIIDDPGQFFSGSGSTWSSGFKVAASPGNVSALDCPTSSFCITGNAAGTEFESSNPTGGQSAWTSQNVDGANAIYGTGCSSAFECVLSDNVGNVIVGTGPPPISVTVSGSGAGAVSGGGISCPGAACTQSYPFATPVVLTATPAAGSTFAGWSGACSGLSTCSLVVNEPRSVTATFTANPPPQPQPPSGTKISKAAISSKRHTARFTFTASGQVTGFQCELKRPRRKHHRAPQLKYAACKSPRTYKSLARGNYVFRVRAVGPGGVDPHPAQRKFKIG